MLAEPTRTRSRWAARGPDEEVLPGVRWGERLAQRVVPLGGIRPQQGQVRGDQRPFVIADIRRVSAARLHPTTTGAPTGP